VPASVSVCRGSAARGEAAAACRRARSACRGEAALRLIDPSKFYSILRPGSINRLKSLTTLVSITVNDHTVAFLLSTTFLSTGAKVPQEQKFHGTKVLGLFAPPERMFHGTKVPQERKFSLLSFCSRERKCRGTKRPVTDRSSHSIGLQQMALPSVVEPKTWWDSMNDSFFFLRHMGGRQDRKK